jgi:hypothetical protein
MAHHRAKFVRPNARFSMNDTQQENPSKKPDPSQKTDPPTDPVDTPKEKSDAPRRMRWPADFPAKH